MCPSGSMPSKGRTQECSLINVVWCVVVWCKKHVKCPQKVAPHHCYEWYTTEMAGLIKQNISPIQQFHGWNTLLVIRIILDNHQTIGTIPVNYYHWPIIINTNCLVHSGTVKLDLNQRILGSINWWMWKSKLFNFYCSNESVNDDVLQ